MNAPPPYGITVELEDADSQEPDSTHREICLRPALAAQDTHAYAPGQVAANYKWAAGVMARLRIAVDYNLEQHRAQHGCGTDQHRQHHGTRCGDIYEENIADPVCTVGGTEYPWLGIYVPAHLAGQWVDHIHATLLRMLAADQAPLPRAQQQPLAQHSTVVPDTTRHVLPQGAENA